MLKQQTKLPVRLYARLSKDDDMTKGRKAK